MRSPLSPRGRGAYQAFTLIELLTVIAIIGILAAITLSIMGGVKERTSISQARSELATLAQALENYKKQYGDYPWTATAVANYSNNVNTEVGVISTATKDDGPGILFNALAGKLGPKGNAITGKSSLELAKFRLQKPENLPDQTSTQKENAILDPWGRRYLYYYKTGPVASWTQPSYILLSAGPEVNDDGNPGVTVANDGTFSIPAAEVVKEADNLYANRQ